MAKAQTVTIFNQSDRVALRRFLIVLFYANHVIIQFTKVADIALEQ